MFPIAFIIKALVGAALLIFWGIAFIILYHLTRFGIGVQPKRFAVVFLFGSLILTGVVATIFSTLDLNSIEL